jgi:amidase
MGKDVAQVVDGMDLLQNGFAARDRSVVVAKPSPKKIRIGRLCLSGTDPKVDRAADQALAKSGFRVNRLDENFKSNWDQAKKDGNTVAAAGAWISNRDYRYKSGGRLRTMAAIVLGEFSIPPGTKGLSTGRYSGSIFSVKFSKKWTLLLCQTLQDLPPTIPRIGKIVFWKRVC